MTVSPAFGQLTGREQVAAQVVTLLQGPPSGSAYPLILYFLAEVERQRGLPPRTIQTPGGYRTGLDFETFTADQLPLLIVASQPVGDAERYEYGTYAQWYEIQVAAVCQDPNGDERVAQQAADWYGAAVAGLLAKNGGLGGPSGFAVDKTVLVSAPRTEFVDGADRRYARSVTVIQSLVEVVVTEQGPTAYGPDPYTAPTGYPQVAKISVALSAKDPLNNTSPANGVAVTSSTGHVVVNE